jgi:hypothetical protein
MEKVLNLNIVNYLNKLKKEFSKSGKNYERFNKLNGNFVICVEFSKLENENKSIKFNIIDLTYPDSYQSFYYDAKNHITFGTMKFIYSKIDDCYYSCETDRFNLIKFGIRDGEEKAKNKKIKVLESFNNYIEKLGGYDYLLNNGLIDKKDIYDSDSIDLCGIDLALNKSSRFIDEQNEDLYRFNFIENFSAYGLTLEQLLTLSDDELFKKYLEIFEKQKKDNLLWVKYSLKDCYNDYLIKQSSKKYLEKFKDIQNLRDDLKMIKNICINQNYKNIKINGKKIDTSYLNLCASYSRFDKKINLEITNYHGKNILINRGEPLIVTYGGRTIFDNSKKK